MECQNCHAENTESRTFCRECGNKLLLTCPECNAENMSDDKFCGKCGNNLLRPKDVPNEFSFDEKLERIQRYLPKGLTEKILSQKGKIEGERKIVTVMFCDMANFTLMVESLGPEKAYRIMDQVYEILIHKVHIYEGIVNEMTGDGVLALFGAPLAIEDAPQRALRSAIAIHSGISLFNEANDIYPPIKMRIGIHTGPVVVGSLGNDLRVEFKAVGDTVNIASRVEGMAKPESTFITEETYRLVEGLFVFESKGARNIKGISNSIKLYELISAKKDIYRPRLGSERKIYSEMVGRNKELNKIELQVAKLIDGAGSVVSIIGEAGVGKSRLVAELVKRQVMSGVKILEGRAISIGRNLSFYPFIDLLKNWSRIKEDDDEAAAFSKLNIAIERVANEKALEIVPFIAKLVGMKLLGRYAERIKGIEGEALEKLIVKNLRDLMKSISLFEPLVIIIEDFQWADESSVELLESLVGVTGQFKILFIIVFRPNYKETGDRIIESVKNNSNIFFIELHLEPLGSRYSKTLINNMLKVSHFPRVIIDQIIERSGGNPFFIEEVVRSFIDEGAVIINNNSFEVTYKMDSVSIPETINEVLMARIDRLEDKTRHLVLIASVIGRNFFYKILTEVAEEIENIDSKISYLKQVQLIRERKRLQEIEYLFKHALAQQAAYDSILIQNRKRLHLKVANSIETIFKDRLNEFYGVLCYHFINGENAEKAEEFMIKAGGEALKSSASNEALHYYKNALELYTANKSNLADPIKIADLQENIARAFLNKGRFIEAIEFFDKAAENRGKRLPKLNALNIPILLLDIAAITLKLYLPTIRRQTDPNESDIDKMIKDLNIMWAIGSADIGRALFYNIRVLRKILNYNISASKHFINCVAGLSCMFSVGGISFSISRKLIEHAKMNFPSSDAKTYHYKPFEMIHNYLIGNWEKNFDNELINDALEFGDLMSASTYLYIQGATLIELGELELAEMSINKQHEIGEEYRFEHSVSDVYVLKSKLLYKSGHFHEAIKLVSKGIEHSEKLKWDIRTIQLLGISARVRVSLNDLDQAKEDLERAATLVSKIGENAIISFFYIDYLMGLYQINLHKYAESIQNGNKKQRKKHKRQFLKIANKVMNYTKKRVIGDRTEAIRLKGNYFWISGDQKSAIKLWRIAMNEGNKLHAKLELSKTYLEVGIRLKESKSNYQAVNDSSADEFLDKARNLFLEMKLQRLIDQLDCLPVHDSCP